LAGRLGLEPRLNRFGICGAAITLTTHFSQGNIMTNNLKELQTHLAKDLVEFENKEVAEEHADLIEETYSKVYNILADIISHDNDLNKSKKQS
jgi:hypothetical protein